MKLQCTENTHPVISLSLKSAKQGDYVSAINSLCNEIQRQFIKYDFIADSGKLNERDNKSFKEVLNSDKRDEMIFKEAVQLLSSYLKQY